MPENKKWETPHLESIDVEKRTQAKETTFEVELEDYAGPS